MTTPMSPERYAPSHTVVVESVEVSAYRIPTDRPESDGTASWDATTVVVVEARAGTQTGIGYTYGSPASATLARSTLADAVAGRDAMAVAGSWEAMVEACRNAGRPGVASMAISAVDVALWDLKARLLGLPLVTLLDAVRPVVPVYGSGGFTNSTQSQLARELSEWVEQGIPRVKIKVGRDPRRDMERVRLARDVIGPDVELFVDANGAFTPKRAIDFASRISHFGVRWFEEPVSADDLPGMRLVRERAPESAEVAAGEYGYMLVYFANMLDAGAVDCLQADVTRCEGITGFLRVAALCEARSMDLSAHCAPALHAHVCCAAPRVRHLEYFHDHVRAEHLLFEGVPEPRDGLIAPDLGRPGHGLELRHSDAQRFAL
jgi:L-alanine-DL-glutamate epimerase-like enolase superfamily enzyme